MEIINDNISKRITSLRFILIILVVFIHNHFTNDNITTFNLAANTNHILVENNFVYWFKLFISEGLGRGSVPLFFVFAAFLQFSKEYRYLDLLRKKVKTILIPFFLWSLATLIFYTIFSLLFKNFISNAYNSKDVLQLNLWTIKDWFHFFIGYKASGNNYPFVTQLWFVRDLFLLICLSPILSYLMKKIEKGLFILISIWFICGFRSIIISNQALFFYILGMYWAKEKIHCIEIVDSIKWYEIIPIFLLLFVYTYTGNTSYVVTKNLIRITSAIILLKFSNIIIHNNKIFRIQEFLSRYSFFVYAIHQPLFLLIFRKLWLRILPMTNSFLSLLEYFCVSIVLIIISLLIGIFLDKFCKPFFRLLNGGR